MKIEGLHEKELFEKKSPFRLIVNQDLNFNYPPHWHNAIELLYVLENPFTVFVDSKEYHLNEKDILFIPVGDIHGFRSETFNGTRIFINFELSSIETFGSMDRIKNQLRDVRLVTLENGSLYTDIEREFSNMLEEYKAEGFTSPLYYAARVIDILIMLCKSTPAQINLESKENKNKISGLDKINKSFEYIEKNYSEDIHLKDIARAAGFSECYFSRIFKDITEKSFHQYLSEYRIKKAELLLADSNYSVSEAAYASGFSSIATFDRLFRQIKGCTPQEFKKLQLDFNCSGS